MVCWEGLPTPSIHPKFFDPWPLQGSAMGSSLFWPPKSMENLRVGPVGTYFILDRNFFLWFCTPPRAKRKPFQVTENVKCSNFGPRGRIFKIFVSNSPLFGMPDGFPAKLEPLDGSLRSFLSFGHFSKKWKCFAHFCYANPKYTWPIYHQKSSFDL